MFIFLSSKSLNRINKLDSDLITDIWVYFNVN
jgi:hypothetical protein